jgi:catechol 2,3-dioxygenase-like lactoylglutathione lyase family enzyme
MSRKVISGIQQVGIGVKDVRTAWKWYKEHFGVDIRVFEDAATASHMKDYMGGEPRKRHAAFALNIQGGGGFEIWQYTERTPQAPKFEIRLGDLGIYSVKIKSRNIPDSFKHFQSKKIETFGAVKVDPSGVQHFFVRDPFNNIFQLVPSTSWFKKGTWHSGAAYGAIIGVSDIEKAMVFYSKLLEYDIVVYDKTGVFEDLKELPGGTNTFRRVLLRHSKQRLGAFSRIFGDSEIELIQVLDRQPQRIYHDRYWGDLGFIHICFDIRGINHLREECKTSGFPFQVDTGDSFDMGESAGTFSYVEDPDGTLIEFVEAHKLMISKKLGIYLNLKKRHPEKALPDWLLKALRFNKAKDI